MSYFARFRDRDSRRRRPALARDFLERLEGRLVLSSAVPHVQVPTTTVLQASQTSIETAQDVTFVATVVNANRQVAIASVGKVKFVVDTPKKVVLGVVKLNKLGEAGITTSKLGKIGEHQVEAQYIPTSSRFAASSATPVNMTVNPLTVSSFLVTPASRRGHLGGPLTVTVTALDAQKQPVTNYTGTVVFSSPSDSWTTFPKAVYVTLGISAPSPQTAGLATFATQSYTFTPADHGTHTFVDEVSFGKGGAESIKVTQANNANVFGKTLFAIG
jgi:hypothetical protein